MKVIQTATIVPLLSIGKTRWGRDRPPCPSGLWRPIANIRLPCIVRRPYAQRPASSQISDKPLVGYSA